MFYDLAVRDSAVFDSSYDISARVFYHDLNDPITSASLESNPQSLYVQKKAQLVIAKTALSTDTAAIGQTDIRDTLRIRKTAH
ncbi:MAG: hypothetical protein GWN00_29725 [Aliifodinibius sp.]|nr:hypothetical protein [Fodinibius sp.]NIY28819.1 hypothetical protein [Fodinibius sp.]